MKLTLIILNLALILSPSAHAALGGEIGGIEAESKVLNVKASLNQTPHYSTYEYYQPKITIHQFAANGKIFAVAWRGKTHPDLALIMGDHYGDFQKALVQAKKTHHGHAPVEIEVDGFHLEMGGHSMALYGRAWLVNQLPPQVDTSELH